MNEITPAICSSASRMATTKRALLRCTGRSCVLFHFQMEMKSAAGAVKIVK